MTTQPLKRAYTGKDIDILTACSTIIDRGITHKTFLVSKRAKWSDPFLPNLKIHINKAFSDFLGINKAKEMRETTQVVGGIQKNALRDLAELKVQIMEDFKNSKKHRDEILSLLGFTAHLKDAQKNSQEALIELLLKFKQNTKTALQTASGNYLFKLKSLSILYV